MLGLIPCRINSTYGWRIDNARIGDLSALATTELGIVAKHRPYPVPRLLPFPTLPTHFIFRKKVFDPSFSLETATAGRFPALPWERRSWRGGALNLGIYRGRCDIATHVSRPTSGGLCCSRPSSLGEEQFQDFRDRKFTWMKTPLRQIIPTQPAVWAAQPLNIGGRHSVQFGDAEQLVEYYDDQLIVSSARVAPSIWIVQRLPMASHLQAAAFAFDIPVLLSLGSSQRSNEELRSQPFCEVFVKFPRPDNAGHLEPFYTCGNMIDGVDHFFYLFLVLH
jgi:hypothetical protein